MQVKEVASRIKADLESLLQSRGFIATDIGSCKIAKKLQIADDEVRFILACKSATSALMMPIRVMRFEGGWQIVRGPSPAELKAAADQQTKVKRPRRHKR